jgi:hypothetical protein
MKNKNCCLFLKSYQFSFLIGMDFGTRATTFLFALDLTVFLLMQSYIEWQKYWLKSKKRNITSLLVTGNQNISSNLLQDNLNPINIPYHNNDNNLGNNLQQLNSNTISIEDDNSKKMKENDFFFGNRSD